MYNCPRRHTGAHLCRQPSQYGVCVFPTSRFVLLFFPYPFFSFPIQNLFWGYFDLGIGFSMSQSSGWNPPNTPLRADRYIPYLPSKERLGSAIRKGIKVPYSTIMRLYRKRFGMRPTPEPKKKASQPTGL